MMADTFNILQHLLPKTLTRAEVQRLRNRARCVPGSDEATTRAFDALVEALDQVDAALARKELDDEKLVRKILQEQERRRESARKLMVDHLRHLDAVVKSPDEVEPVERAFKSGRQKLFGSELLSRHVRETINGEQPTNFVRHNGQPLAYNAGLHDRLVALGILPAVEETC